MSHQLKVFTNISMEILLTADLSTKSVLQKLVSVFFFRIPSNSMNPSSCCVYILCSCCRKKKLACSIFPFPKNSTFVAAIHFLHVSREIDILKEYYKKNGNYRKLSARFLVRYAYEKI